MKISFIIPAYNEAALLGRCVQSIQTAVTANQVAGDTTGLTVEIIVVDNNSTDATAAIAEAAGASVVFEAINQISRARNSGASVATGDWLIFVDADSLLSPGLLRETLERIAANTHLGMGSRVYITDIHNAPFWSQQLLRFWTWISERLSWAAGSYIACDAEAFRALGGFSEQLYAAEEIDFSRRIKRLAKARSRRFEVLTTHPLETSNRKLTLYSGREMFWQIMRLIFRPRATLKTRSALDVWYDGRR